MQPRTINDLQDSIAQMLKLNRVADSEDKYLYEISDSGVRVRADFLMDGVIHMRFIHLFKMSVSWMKSHKRFPQGCWHITSQNVPKGCVTDNLDDGMIAIIEKSLSRMGQAEDDSLSPLETAILCGMDVAKADTLWPGLITEHTVTTPLH